jgi:hypothetical protein
MAGAKGAKAIILAANDAERLLWLTNGKRWKRLSFYARVNHFKALFRCNP